MKSIDAGIRLVMSRLRKLFHREAPCQPPEPHNPRVARLVRQQDQLEERVDALYRIRTGHPIGDALERRHYPRNANDLVF